MTTREPRPRPTAVSSVLRLGGGASRRDIYHRLVTMSWARFFALLAIAYFIFNICFALLYVVQPGSIGNAGAPSFLSAFFFSVQTMATIGFGVMYPATLYANFVVTVEALLGMAGFALATGLIFQRFSRPRARVRFSKVAVVMPYDGAPTLMFRCANERSNQILEAEVHVSFSRDETSSEGLTLRRFHDLVLARSRNPLFSLTWTVMHPIAAKSPLHGVGAEELAAGGGAQLVVTLTGIDDSLSQTIFAQHIYDAADIRWGHRFVDILSTMEDGRRLIDYRRFDETAAHRG
jgi:inward rectifier potassium channel